MKPSIFDLSSGLAVAAVACVIKITYAQEDRLVTNQPRLKLVNVPAQLLNDKPTAQTWIVKKASLAVQDKDGYLGIALELAKNVPPPLLWHRSWAMETLQAQNKGAFKIHIASITDPKIDGRLLTLGHLLDCVNTADLGDKPETGEWIILATRVVRFLSGNCACHGCGAEIDHGDFTKIPELPATFRAKISANWNREAYEAFADGANWVERAAMRKFCGF